MKDTEARIVTHLQNQHDETNLEMTQKMESFEYRIRAIEQNELRAS